MTDFPKIVIKSLKVPENSDQLPENIPRAQCGKQLGQFSDLSLTPLTGAIKWYCNTRHFQLENSGFFTHSPAFRIATWGRFRCVPALSRTRSDFSDSDSSSNSSEVYRDTFQRYSGQGSM